MKRLIISSLLCAVALTACGDDTTMNNDHPDSLSRYIGGGPGEMAGIDGEGFDVLRTGKKVRIPFTTPVTNMEEARKALVEMARR